jgi:DNA adenine methylase
MRYLTPLRYPGGKAKLARFVKRLIEKNGLLGGHYVEPYAGGASVALSLLLENYVTRIHINDFDPAVHAFWHAVLFETEGLCRLIRNKRISVTEWRRQRAIQNDPGGSSLLDYGFSTFFLNRTNRSGIISSAGMIGGVHQNGRWKLNARYNKKALISRIERISQYRSQISLYGLDAARMLRKLLPTLPKSTLLYLDPPYYVKGNRRLYANCYQHSDHEDVARFLASTTASWLVSYDDVPEIRQMYRKFRRRHYTLSYTARERYQGAEVLFFSADLAIPAIVGGGAILANSMVT